jgi:23S rRNA pseudouridine1911/1915/1917 synthase
MEVTDEEDLDYSLPTSADTSRDAVMPQACAGLRMDLALARVFTDFSRSQLRQWLEDGRLLVDGNATEATRKARGGERLHLEPGPSHDGSLFLPEPMPLAIVFEDADIAVIDKPVGLVVHPGAGHRGGTLLNGLVAHHPGCADLPRAGIVHRLDKDTSGLMVVAKTLEAQTSLVRQLQARTVARTYHAVVHGKLNRSGTVDAPIGRHPVHRTRMAVTPQGKPARTHYTPLRGGDGWTLVECRLETGRTHQIRVHMQSLGYPLIGDPVYGVKHASRIIASALAGFDRQALHATALALLHPRTDTPMRWESPIPADFATLIDKLQGA